MTISRQLKKLSILVSGIGDYDVVQNCSHDHLKENVPCIFDSTARFRLLSIESSATGGVRIRILSVTS